MDKLSGFEEIDHTADWEIQVWGPDLPALLEQAARGMYTLVGLTTGPGPNCKRGLEIRSSDPEGLLVNFLAELLYLEAAEGLVMDQFEIEVVGPDQANGYRLSANLLGAPAAAAGKDIKAVTYHKMNIVQGSRGLEVRIVFDV